MSTTGIANKKTAIVRYQEHGVSDQEVALAIRKISKSVEKLSGTTPVEPTYDFVNGGNINLLVPFALLGTAVSVIGGFALSVSVSPLFIFTPIVSYALLGFLHTTSQKFGKSRFFWTRKMRRNLENNLARKAKYELDCEEHRQEIASVTEKLAPQLKLLNERNPTISFGIDQITGELTTARNPSAIDKLHPTEIEIIEKFNAF